MHPIWTNLNLLPYQKPFGFLKIPSATVMHRSTLAKIEEHLHEDLNNPVLNIVYAHFNIPHVPMIDSANFSWADSGRFNESECNYIKQIKYVDTIVNSVNAQISEIAESRPVNLFILSDHNIRNLTQEYEHSKTVLIFQSSNKSKLSIGFNEEKINTAEFIIKIITNN